MEPVKKTDPIKKVQKAAAKVVKHEEASTVASEKDMKATKKEHAAFDMCRDFMKGRCRFGRDCYYSHDVKGFRAE